MAFLTNEPTATLNAEFLRSALVQKLLRAIRCVERRSADHEGRTEALEKILRANAHREHARRQVDRLLR